MASPAGEYKFKWVFDNGESNDGTAKNESNRSSDYTEFKIYEPVVTLYDLNGKQLATDKVSLTIKEKKEEIVSKGTGMDGKWINYGIGYGGGSLEKLSVDVTLSISGGGSLEKLSVDVTLSISGGQFSMSKSGGGVDPWTGGGYVREYTDASGEQAYELVADTGNKMDDSNFATYFGLERGELYLTYSVEQDELRFGTSGAKLYFKRN